MDNSLHFSVEKEDGVVKAVKNETKITKPTGGNVQSQLDEIDNMMNDDKTIHSESTDRDYEPSTQVEEYTDEQLIKLTETIKFLRIDRDQLETKLHEIEDGKLDERRNVELYKSQLEEKEIEVGIMSKRYSKQIETLQRNLEEANKQKEILKEKNKLISSKIDIGISKKEYDLTRIRKREIELENKLEMLKSDTQVQLKTREDKIIELKRRIDTLEFDMSTIQSQETKSVVKRNHLEHKLDKVIDTLRDAIEDLETSDIDLENIEELSKRLKDSI
jgi:chromosome segregation ATPase